MTTHEGTFNLPFLNSWIGQRPVQKPAFCHGKQLPGKELAICLDDDPLSLRLVEYLLKSRYEVISCANIDAAIRAVKKHSIHLFLCDYHLGEQFTGARAFDILTTKYGFNPIHSILITSYPSDEIEQISVDAGFSKVFAKPLRREFQLFCLNLWMPPASCPVAVV